MGPSRSSTPSASWRRTSLTSCPRSCAGSCRPTRPSTASSACRLTLASTPSRALWTTCPSLQPRMESPTCRLPLLELHYNSTNVCCVDSVHHLVEPSRAAVQCPVLLVTLVSLATLVKPVSLLLPVPVPDVQCRPKLEY